MSQMVSVQGQVMPTRLVNVTKEHTVLESACCHSKRVQFRQCRLSQTVHTVVSVPVSAVSNVYSRLPEFTHICSVPIASIPTGLVSRD